MQNSFLLFSLFFFGFAVSVHGQTQTGFISIDCGAREKFAFVDPDTGISYTSEESYINTGINKNISSEYAYPNNPTLPQPLSDLRSFPLGDKNCYNLRPTDGRGSLNLIRASFLYGNYDGENRPPEFDLYLDVSLWFSVKFNNASDIVATEVISFAPADTINVCLVNKGLGIPFISALELRPLNASLYNGPGISEMLVLFKRLDIGSSGGSGRYKDDIYDRIWSPYNAPSWEVINGFSAVDDTGNGYKAPKEVIRTAASPGNGSASLGLNWTTSDQNSQFYIYMYFAELEQLGRNQSRVFNISWNGIPLFGPIRTRPLYASTISNSAALVGKEHRVSVYKVDGSTLPPILNAIEIYMVKQSNTTTSNKDVEAIMNIKATYQVNKNWIGDPCGPKNYSWEGLECRYNGSNPPRIISLNLTSSSLSGQIVTSIANLTSLETLDLSNNSFSGGIPEFLEELPFLEFLNLKCNHLSGSVPSALLDRSKAGSLTLSVDSQNLCTSGKCRKKKNIIVPIIASISSALVVLVVVSAIVCKIRRNRTKKAAASNKEGRALASKNKQFTYDEIINITDNFQTAIGKGGFGTVYLGHVKDGTKVAVKMLSSSSSQGSKEFQTEAELLMRVHHRNLTSFIGYCDDGDRVALIYEYMANGNLKDYISGKNAYSFSWEMRLRVAIDAAQGLEYLHQGCKPSIIHSDVKSANILLSESLDAKIADFGLSKAFTNDNSSHVMTRVIGTTGYLDPEYYITQNLNEKSDVYSFGIVLFELITGHPAIIRRGDPIHIVQWLKPMLKRRDVTRIVDQRLLGDYHVNSVWKAIETAIACTTATSIRRATMSFVLVELKECLALEMSREKTRSGNEESFVETDYSTEISTTEVYSTDFESMPSSLH